MHFYSQNNLKKTKILDKFRRVCNSSGWCGSAEWGRLESCGRERSYIGQLQCGPPPPPPPPPRGTQPPILDTMYCSLIVCVLTYNFLEKENYGNFHKEVGSKWDLRWWEGGSWPLSDLPRSTLCPTLCFPWASQKIYLRIYIYFTSHIWKTTFKECGAL